MESIKSGGSYAVVFGKKLQAFAAEALGMPLTSVFAPAKELSNPGQGLTAIALWDEIIPFAITALGGNAAEFASIAAAVQCHGLPYSVSNGHQYDEGNQAPTAHSP